jgi:uncharacterized membrane protein SirB2
MTQPELKSDDATSEAKLLFNHILGGAGFPPHWFAAGQELTRATAIAMDLPTKKQLRSRQKYFKSMIALIFRFAIHQAVAKDQLDDSKKNAKFKIILPKIEDKEIETVAGALVNVTNSLSIAVEEGWITDKTAQVIYAYVLSMLGMEVDAIKATSDVVAEADKIVDDKTKKFYEKRKAKETKTAHADE